EKLNPTVKTDETGLVQNKKIHEFVDRVQRIVEGANFSMREYNLKLDDVINEQRNVIYKLRNKSIESEDQIQIILPFIHETSNNILDSYCNDEIEIEHWDLTKLKQELEAILLNTEIVLPNDVLNKSDLETMTQQAANEYEKFVVTFNDNEMLQRTLKSVLLQLIDINWIKHLENMTRLKEGIGLRYYQQEDPMRIYQQEG